MQSWLLRCGCLAGLLAFGVPVHAENWPEFRGPTGQGHSHARGLPVKWSESDQVLWKTSIPGKGWSSPIVQGGRIYLTSAVPRPGGDDFEQSLRALCVDAGSGRILWDKEVFEQPAGEASRIHSKNSHASATPITDGKHVYVHFGTHGTACLTTEGGVVWKTQELKYQPRHGNGGSPAIVGDLLIIICDGFDVQFVVALERGSGKVRWKTPRPAATRFQKFAFSTPLLIEVDGRPQVVCPGANHMVAYNPEDGQELWRVSHDGFSTIPRPVYGHGLLFLPTGYESPAMIAVRPTGSGDVTESHVAWRITRGAPNTPSVLLVGDELYFVSDGGVATCLDAKSGKEHWQKRLGGNYSASPLFADGKIYFQSEQGDTTVIQAGRDYVELARNSLGERTYASFAVADSSLIVRTEKQLLRIGGTATAARQ